MNGINLLKNDNRTKMDRGMEKVFPKSLLQENDFDKLLNSQELKNNKNASIKFIKDHSLEEIGLKSARIYY